MNSCPCLTVVLQLKNSLKKKMRTTQTKVQTQKDWVTLLFSLTKNWVSRISRYYHFLFEKMQLEGIDDYGNTKKGIECAGLNRHGNLKTASSDQNLKDILLRIKSSKTPAVINYGASWCRVCNQILPTFCKLSNNFPKFSFIYADIDECPETTQHIRFTPTFQFYRDGERVDEMFGAGEERLHDRLWLHS